MKDIKLKKEKRVEKKSEQKTISPVREILEKNPPEIIQKIKAIIYQALQECFFQIKIGENAVNIEHPKLNNYGDFSTNIAMIMAGRLKMKPMDAAEKLSRKIEEYIKGHQLISIKAGSADSKKIIFGADDVLENVNFVLPGFVNLYLTKKWLISQMNRLPDIDQTAKSGKTAKNEANGKYLPLKGLKTVIEYTDPNPFKEFHIGHLISNVTGETLSRIRESNGATLFRTDYFGDVGTHAAKSIWGILKKMSEENMTLELLTEKNLQARINFLGQGYAIGTRAYEEDEKAKEEIGRLNTVLYMAAQKMWEKEGVESNINYDPKGKIKQEEINKVYELFITGRQWSLDYFVTIYKRLGTKFDGYYPESRVGEIGYKLVLDNINKVFERSEEAIVFKGEKFGLHTRVFINKHNLPTYEAKELGLAPSKYKDFPYDESIIVVGKEIKEYFQVLVTALKQVIPSLGEKTFPICTGMVKLPQGKMSSRSGNVVTVTGLLDELKAIIKKKLVEQDYELQEKEEISEKVSVGALKYAFLKNSIGLDFIFDIDKALSLAGDSGPYVMYTYARCKSVLGKAPHFVPRSGTSKGQQELDSIQMNAEELELLREFYKFEEVVWEAGKNLAPNIICSYLYDLAQKFNLFYQKHTILGNRSQEIGISSEIINFRLSLTQATAIILKKGLYLLGIETVERM